MLPIRPNDLTSHQGWYFLLRVDQEHMTLEVKRGNLHRDFPVQGTLIMKSETDSLTRLLPPHEGHPSFRIECANCLIKAAQE